MHADCAVVLTKHLQHWMLLVFNAAITEYFTQLWIYFVFYALLLPPRQHLSQHYLVLLLIPRDMCGRAARAANHANWMWGRHEGGMTSEGVPEGLVRMQHFVQFAMPCKIVTTFQCSLLLDQTDHWPCIFYHLVHVLVT